LGLCDTAGVAREPAEGAGRIGGRGPLVLLRRVGVVDPTDVDAYQGTGGYEGLRRAMELGPAGTLAELAASRLVGRGGAAFPVARKWQAVASNPVRPHYLVCNADESEPGTFKDRVLLEGDPFAVIEAMTIAAFATGCEHGYLYVRGEYRRAGSVLSAALDAARRRGLLGTDLLGHGYSFDIELRRGAGAYICGEETALFNSLEGFRGEPRSKPPFPVDVGLFGKPTVVNNVETLANVPVILAGGGDAFAAVGTEESTGTKLFAVSGCVSRSGVYEVPFGTTLRAVLELAGVGAGAVRAVLLGGAAGVFALPSELDVPLTFEGTRASGLTLGSGAVIVLDDRADLDAFLRRIAAFFRSESCGQCVPCREGTVRQAELLERVLVGDKSGRGVLRDVADVMRDASICGLGQTAGTAIQSAIEKLGIAP
jgi:NADH-quinone oxidoreductase subunit F